MPAPRDARRELHRLSAEVLTAAAAVRQCCCSYISIALLPSSVVVLDRDLCLLCSAPHQHCRTAACSGRKCAICIGCVDASESAQGTTVTLSHLAATSKPLACARCHSCQRPCTRSGSGGATCGAGARCITVPPQASKDVHHRSRLTIKGLLRRWTEHCILILTAQHSPKAFRWRLPQPHTSDPALLLLWMQSRLQLAVDEHTSSVTLKLASTSLGIGGSSQTARMSYSNLQQAGHSRNHASKSMINMHILICD